MPTLDALVKDIKLIRRRGITTLGTLDLPALRQAGVASGHVQQEAEAGSHVIESLLRASLDDIAGGPVVDGGPIANAGAVLFGLMPGTRGTSPTRLRDEARDFFKVSYSRFRNHYEDIVIREMAQQILRRCHDHELREAARAMDRRLPVASRLAIAWLDRFEAYRAMWNPAHSMAASIVAYRSTLLEADRPYDRPPTPEEPDGYTQEMRAHHYGWEGLFFLAWYYAELTRFETRFGGLVLLASKAAEREVENAMYLMYYWTPFSVQHQSFLRLKYNEAHGEMHSFSLLKEEDLHFIRLHELWQQFLANCTCHWEESRQPERGHFHTHRTVPTIEEGCPPHRLIAAANDYCTIIDSEWDLIADWYHESEPRPKPVDAVVLYEQLREQQRRKGSKQWPPWGTPPH